MGEHKNWFARNKGFVFGFAVAVAILNIVIFVLMPQQTPIRIDETVTEYVCGDESFAAEHTIQLTGTLTRSMLSKPTGGVSGPAIHAIAVRMVWEAANAVKIPINGMGGVATWEDAAEMILAGATSVTVGTASFYDPTAAVKIVDGLAAWAAEQGASDINELIGAAEC